MTETLKNKTLSILCALALSACASRPPQAPAGTTPVAPAATAPASAAPVPPPAPPARPEAPPAPPAVDESRLVFFMLGSSTPKPAEKAKVEAMAERLKADKSLQVTLIGHANDNGSRSYSLAISDARVRIVAELLRKHGVAPGQIRREALGNEKLPKDCTSAACRQRYRSVEMRIGEDVDTLGVQQSFTRP